MKNVDIINLYDMSAIVRAGAASSQSFGSYPPKHDWNVRHIPTGGINHFFQQSHTATFKKRNYKSLDVCCFDSRNSFRKSLYPAYKGNRAKPVESYIVPETNYTDLKEMISLLREAGVYKTKTSVEAEANNIVFKHAAFLTLDVLYWYLPAIGLTCLKFDEYEADDIIAAICRENPDTPIHIWADDEDYGQMHIFHPRITIHSVTGMGERIRTPKNYIEYIIHGQAKDNIPDITVKLGSLAYTVKEKVYNGKITYNDLVGYSDGLIQLGLSPEQRQLLRINTLLMYPAALPVQPVLQDAPTVINMMELEKFLNTFKQNQEIRYLHLGSSLMDNVEDVYINILNKRTPFLAEYFDNLK